MDSTRRHSIATTLSVRAHATQLGVRADTVVTPFGAHPHLDALRAEPTFPEHGVKRASPWTSPGWTSAPLIACQPRVNMDYVEQLRRSAPAVGDTDGLLQFCLPLQGSVPAIPIEPKFNPGSNTFSWLSENPDVRVCGPIKGAAPGTGRAMVGFALGPGLHQMSVVSFAGKHMLNNGYHHAVALALAGHTRIPVIIVSTVARRRTRPPWCASACSARRWSSARSLRASSTFSVRQRSISRASTLACSSRYTRRYTLVPA